VRVPKMSSAAFVTRRKTTAALTAVIPLQKSLIAESVLITQLFCLRKTSHRAE
jgi:hypothetical protein